MKLLLKILIILGMQKVYANTFANIKQMSQESKESSEGSSTDGPVGNCSGCAHT